MDAHCHCTGCPTAKQVRKATSFRTCRTMIRTLTTLGCDTLCSDGYPKKFCFISPFTRHVFSVFLIFFFGFLSKKGVSTPVVEQGFNPWTMAYTFHNVAILFSFSPFLCFLFSAGSDVSASLRKRRDLTRGTCCLFVSFLSLFVVVL